MDEIPRSQRQHLAAHEPRWDQPREEAEQEAQPEHRAAVLGGQHEHDEEQGDRQQDVDEAHHDPVDEAADKPRDRAPQGSDHGGDHRREEADLERRLASDHDPPQLVEAVLVGSQQVRATGGQVGDQRIEVGLVGVVDQRTDEPEEDEEQDDSGADHRQTVGQ